MPAPHNSAGGPISVGEVAAGLADVANWLLLAESCAMCGRPAATTTSVAFSERSAAFVAAVCRDCLPMTKEAAEGFLYRMTGRLS